MKLLRAATLSVPDPVSAAARYAQWLDYAIAETGALPADLAQSWGAPNSAGRAYAVAAPASGADVYLRFVECEPVPDYRPLRTYGWAAIEICVQDVLKVNERMLRSPFTIIGPPQQLDGLPTIFPMQVRGPDQEIVYLTEIRGDLPEYDLPRAASLIDKLFILVLACSDMKASLAWFESHVKLQAGRDMALIYTMLNDAFALPAGTKHTLATMTHGRDVFLELDQYPAEATARPGKTGALPPGIALGTFQHPDFSKLDGPWITPPSHRDGVLYRGGRAGTMRAPDGTLVEVVEIV